MTRKFAPCSLYLAKGIGIIYTDHMGEPFWLSGSLSYHNTPSPARPASNLIHLGPVGEMFNKLEQLITEMCGYQYHV